MTAPADPPSPAGTDLRPLIDILTDLPTLSAIATQLLRLLNDPNSSANDITLALSQDMALSARLLRVVNSPFYGFPRRIHSIAQAVVIVGFKHLRTMALSLSVIEAFGSAGGRLDYAGFWRHSLFTALWARALAETFEPRLADAAYLAGLLHDIGKMTLGLLDENALAAVVREQERSGELFLYAERRVLPYDHPRLGAALLEHWNIPEDVSRAVAWHHDPGEAPPEHRTLAALVHTADLLTRAFLAGWCGDERIPRLADAAWTLLGESWDRVAHLVPSMLAEGRRAEAFFFAGPQAAKS